MSSFITATQLLPCDQILSERVTVIASRQWLQSTAWGHSFSCTHPCAPRLQPECQEEEEGGGRMRWLSSCICRRMGRRKPHEMFSSPSTMSSPSSCTEQRDGHHSCHPHES